MIRFVELMTGGDVTKLHKSVVVAVFYVEQLLVVFSNSNNRVISQQIELNVLKSNIGWCR